MGSTMILPGEKAAAQPSIPRVLPWSEPSPNSLAAPAKVNSSAKTPQPGAPRQPPPLVGPAEVPLPPPPFADRLPPPAPKTVLQPSNFEELNVIHERPTPVAPAPPAPKRIVGNSSAVRVEAIANNPARAREGDCILTGEVQQFRRGWRLRYAALDVADPHGGSVGLLGTNLDHVKEGARIRVSGTLIPGEDRPGSARFQVRTLEVLDN